LAFTVNASTLRV